MTVDCIFAFSCNKIPRSLDSKHYCFIRLHQGADIITMTKQLGCSSLELIRVSCRAIRHYCQPQGKNNGKTPKASMANVFAVEAVRFFHSSLFFNIVSYIIPLYSVVFVERNFPVFRFFYNKFHCDLNCIHLLYQPAH